MVPYVTLANPAITGGRYPSASPKEDNGYPRYAKVL